jgi:hypothetical protein
MTIPADHLQKMREQGEKECRKDEIKEQEK